MKFISTRGDKNEYSSSQAIIKGLADDKGLFVPVSIPSLASVMGENDIVKCLETISKMPYTDLAKKIIGAFFDDFTDEEIANCVDSSYTYGETEETGKFAAKEIVPVVKAGDAWILELYHGRTSAFKDMALSILPYLLTTSIKKEGEKSKICILTATSGDTGKAALAGFADVPGTEICVFYPVDGVSQVQKAQMVTQTGENTHVFAIKGNFDDAQTGVKKIFNDEDFNGALNRQGVKLSSANSINVGRLIPQVVYYAYGYGTLVSQGVIKAGDPVNIVVPTGNFGNILAAFYAHLMGIPVNKFICASNENKVLTDFINTGVYDARRDFFVTNSPSMDILISSNLERLLYLLSLLDSQESAAATIKDLMASLDKDSYYEVDSNIKEGLKKFHGGFASVEETNRAISTMYKENSYLMDTHTAVAYKVYKDYVEETGDKTPAVIASTASPFKFARSVAESIGLDCEGSDFEIVKLLSEETGIAIPEGLRDLDKREVRFKETIEIDEMPDAVKQSL